jgi:hypothetical protein
MRTICSGAEIVLHGTWAGREERQWKYWKEMEEWKVPLISL